VHLREVLDERTDQSQAGMTTTVAATATYAHDQIACRGDANPRLGIGLDVGSAYVGIVGEGEIRRFSVIGDVATPRRARRALRPVGKSLCPRLSQTSRLSRRARWSRWSQGQGRTDRGPPNHVCRLNF